MLSKICTRADSYRQAKSAPYPPCTPDSATLRRGAACRASSGGVTAFWLKDQDPARMLRRVTQPPHIAGPLGVIAHNL
jgi:hypothetical protein